MFGSGDFWDKSALRFLKIYPKSTSQTCDYLLVLIEYLITYSKDGPSVTLWLDIIKELFTYCYREHTKYMQCDWSRRVQCWPYCSPVVNIVLFDEKQQFWNVVAK